MLQIVFLTLHGFLWDFNQIDKLEFSELFAFAQKPAPWGSAAAHSRPAEGGSRHKQLHKTNVNTMSNVFLIGIALRAAVGSRATIIRLRRAVATARQIPVCRYPTKIRDDPK